LLRWQFPPVTADTIPVAAGLVVIGPVLGGGGSLSLLGDRGFTLTGSISPTARVDARTTCFPCVVGDQISTDAFAGDLDLGVTSLTFEGVTYTDVNTLTSLNTVSVGFDGPMVTAPPHADTAVLSVPFTMSGLLFVSPNQGPTVQHDLAGSGLASLTLRRAGDIDLWEFGGMEYRLGETTAPVPEPSSDILLATGLAGLVGLVRKRRDSH
jgi:hypothetical protein